MALSQLIWAIGITPTLRTFVTAGLPGLLLAFARRHDLDPARSTLIGTRPAHRTLAATLAMRYVNL